MKSPPSPPAHDLAARDRDAIRRYYEQNTPLFLRFARAETQTIHRAVWGDGVDSLTRALDFTNELVLREINAWIEQHEFARVRIADLGCGIGGSLFYLLPRLAIPVRAVGVTISRVQAELAQLHARRLDLTRACWFVEGDFLAPPLADGLGIAYSIEAFCHATLPEMFLAQAARVLASGGKLILCDDFLSPLAREAGSAAQRWLAAYQKGWHVPNLRTYVAAQALASEHDLNCVRNDDLTPYLKLRALPNWFAAALRAMGERVPAWHAIVPSMLGSLALQQCLKQNLIEYRFLVFEKS
ncbi:MAG: methyltransferase domain-containing protein [Chloroflexi bacterium]|nr:methyltransferase domain-containing protein [Chloroflexota bacterium]